MKTTLWLTVLGTLTVSSSVAAQSTGLATFNSPYRLFTRHEVGFSLTFPGYDDTAVEGNYRFGSGKFDFGLRGGVIFVRTGVLDDEVLVFGVEARQRVITQSDDFPADGALILGAGLRLGAADNFLASAGLSLGRRLDIEDSDVSIVPFVQPATWLVLGDGGEDLIFAIGLGADFRLSPRFNLRTTIGVGDVDGLSVSALWIR